MRIPGNRLCENEFVPLSLPYINSLLTTLPASSFPQPVIFWKHDLIPYVLSLLKAQQWLLGVLRFVWNTPGFSLENLMSQETPLCVGPTTESSRATDVVPAHLPSVHLSPYIYFSSPT